MVGFVIVNVVEQYIIVFAWGKLRPIEVLILETSPPGCSDRRPSNIWSCEIVNLWSRKIFSNSIFVVSYNVFAGNECAEVTWLRNAFVIHAPVAS